MQGLCFSLSRDDVINMHYKRANKDFPIIQGLVFTNNPSKKWTFKSDGEKTVQFLPPDMGFIIHSRQSQTTLVLERSFLPSSLHCGNLGIKILTSLHTVTSKPLSAKPQKIDETHVIYPEIQYFFLFLILGIMDQLAYIMMNWVGFNCFGICQFEVERGMDQCKKVVHVWTHVLLYIKN